MAKVPADQVLDPTLTASDKVVLMARRLFPAAGPAELERRTGLSRHSVLRGMALARPGRPESGRLGAKIPASLLADRTVGSQAKVVYGALQVIPNSLGHTGEFTFATLHAHTRISCSALKRAVAELRAAGWVRLTQRRRLSPIRFKLGTPELHRALIEVERAGRRLKRAEYRGEALMQEYLTLLIDSDQFTDNARPGFLVNPQTGERLELDRYYPPSVGFEFNGAHHYHATGRISQAEAEAQHFRDLIKAGVCLYRGVHLVVIHPEDLSLQGITGKVGRCLPLRDLSGHEPLIDWLEGESIRYRASLAKERSR